MRFLQREKKTPENRNRRLKIVWDKQGSHRNSKNTLNPFRTSKSSLNLRRGGNKHLQKIPKAAPEGAEMRRQKPPKRPPKRLQNPLDPVARKRKPVLSVLTRPPGAQTLRFPRFFHFRSTLRDPPFWGLLGTILEPDLVPVYMYIYIYIYIYHCVW